PGRLSGIGYLTSHSTTASPRYIEAFRQGLHDLGWVEGQNIVIEYRFAEGKFDQLPALAADLVRLKVDVIAAGPTPPAVAAKNATRTIPVVMISAGDPVQLGLVESLARPGGNVTGLSYSVGVETFGKSLELLKEARPQGPPPGDPLKSGQSGPRARPTQHEGGSRTDESGASVPRDACAEPVRRCLCGDDQGACGRTPCSGRFAV